ncbi:hypothetical protein AAY473_026462, partial [Plecturocebus cupreus]
MVFLSLRPSSRDQHIVDAYNVFDEYERMRRMTLLMKKLSPRDETALTQKKGALSPTYTPLRFLSI